MYALTKATTANATKADQRSAFINEKGPYVGKFSRAEKLYSDRTGAHGIGFDFKSKNGEKLSASIWTHNDAGAQWSGFDLVMALLAVTGAFNIKPARRASLVWDREQQKEVSKEMEQFAELIGPEVGILVRMVEEERKDGQGTYWKPEIVGFYRPADDLTASEIIAHKTVPEKLEQLIAALKDKPLKRNGGANASRGNSGHPNAPGNGGGFPDDDIPF
ncbi:hypothetical protein [Paraburkholderia phosphatilytica]|uniref:hypothetical protein n=1 Tax=Paraburkholderia phosphatilytica TaxID=2282883 RepID=UPI000E502CCB|nr:hypothetical protein [Paraburkholderia phosphatilytica]